jgi:hypothetical protein
MKKIVVLGLFVLSLGMVGCSCDLGETRCDGNQAQACGGSNNWVTYATCGTNTTCQEGVANCLAYGGLTGACCR